MARGAIGGVLLQPGDELRAFVRDWQAGQDGKIKFVGDLRIGRQPRRDAQRGCPSRGLTAQSTCSLLRRKSADWSVGLTVNSGSFGALAKAVRKALSKSASA